MEEHGIAVNLELDAEEPDAEGPEAGEEHAKDEERAQGEGPAGGEERADGKAAQVFQADVLKSSWKSHERTPADND